MKVTTVGIDLAKNVFQVHGVDERGRWCCASAAARATGRGLCRAAAVPDRHGGVRRRTSLGAGATSSRLQRTVDRAAVRQAVRQEQQERAADAEAICEAVARPNMRFVPVKSVEQQAVLAVHRIRHGLIKERTAQANQIRGLLAEFGLVVPRGLWHVHQRVPALLERAADVLPLALRHLIERLLVHLRSVSASRRGARGCPRSRPGSRVVDSWVTCSLRTGPGASTSGSRAARLRRRLPRRSSPSGPGRGSGLAPRNGRSGRGGLGARKSRRARAGTGPRNPQ